MSLNDKFKSFTDARIGLGRAGSSLPTKEQLAFQLDHARARDAVYSQADFEKIEAELKKGNINSMLLQSQAKDRSEYLRRPDLGRKLNEKSLKKVVGYKSNYSATEFDLAVVVCDGLSATAINQTSVLFVSELIPECARRKWSVAPVFLVSQGRVAAGDPVAEAVSARLLVVLIGERPGLSSPDSMGLYMTYQSKSGTTDERRNCISNIRPGGLSTEHALKRFLYLADLSMVRQISGVNLKDESDPAGLSA